jgi:hypothetical protein
MKPGFNLITAFVISLFINSLPAQEMTGTIKGFVKDKYSNAPLTGVNVILLNSDELQGTITDADGYFKLENIPTGRRSIKISYVGYGEIVLDNLFVGTGKDLILNIEMEEKVTELNELVITATDKRGSVNDMATLSARTFSVEESERYAGSYGDVSRMAMNYAGVVINDDNYNDIIIRGNSPFGLLWRLDGIDIPNPNHFGDGGASGGVISMLNNNVLANSDFITSALPAEYGNALSGVFDLKMKNGNYEKYEFLGQLAFSGVELGIQGPVRRKNKSSFIANYRYSTPVVFSYLGIDIGTGDAMPYYQDFSAKVNYPTKKAGTFSLITLAGKSSIDFLYTDKDSANASSSYMEGDQNIRMRTYTGVMGLNHTYQFNNKTYSRISVAVTGTETKYIIDSIDIEDWRAIDYYRQDFVRYNYIFKAVLNKKFSSKDFVRLGYTGTYRGFDMIDSTYMYRFDRFHILRDFNGYLFHHQAFVQWQHKCTDEIILNAGVHSQSISLNNNTTFEPRVGISWEFIPNHKISAGYGYHTQLPPVYYYKTKVTLADETSTMPNTGLKFVTSQHYVVGYDVYFSRSWRMKTEAYYQDIDNAVTDYRSSSFCSLNRSFVGYSAIDTLTNNGKGYNYGIEMTLEKFMTAGNYFLTTVSLFESKYKGSDEIWRNTAFNGNYVVNMLGGKEFYLKSKRENPKSRIALTLDTKLTLAGGKRYTPVDLDASRLAGATVYQEDQAYSRQLGDYFRFDFRIGVKEIMKNMTQEWGLDLVNLTNRRNDLDVRYNSRTDSVKTAHQQGFQWMMLWRINF